jgi:hypothetical protein
VIVGPLRHAEQRVDLRQNPRQRAARPQHVEHARRLFLHQAARHFLPHTFGHQRVHLAFGHHLAHQRQRLRRDVEVHEPCREPRDPQNPHGVFEKRIAYVPEEPRLQIGATVERVDHRTGQFTVRAHLARHRVDRQIAACQVFLQRDVRRIEKLEAVITRRRLALGARKGVLLLRLRMQEHRKILAHRTVALRDHLLGGRADHDVIAVLHRHAQQLVANRATYRVDIHGHTS